jgi:hypothetical protein
MGTSIENKYTWILGIFAFSLLLSGGMGYWIYFADDRDPKFHNVSLEPREFRFTGGSFQVLSEVSDDVAIDRVRGVLWRGDSQMALVALARSDDGVNGTIAPARSQKRK